MYEKIDNMIWKCHSDAHVPMEYTVSSEKWQGLLFESAVDDSKYIRSENTAFTVKNPVYIPNTDDNTSQRLLTKNEITIQYVIEKVWITFFEVVIAILL